MTILINGWVDFSPDNAPRALAASKELIAETRSQKGCREYVWSEDPTTPGRLYVYENWESVEDLAAHLAGKYYLGMLEILGQFELKDTSVLKYRIDHAEPVYDPQGKPRADFFSG
jgi:quinol monooxygenase YgiN